MRALLLAGGLGTRLRPLTDTVPKCLVPIKGRPLLDYWLDALFEAGFERALINTHWLAPAVATHVGQSLWADQLDLVHEPELLGTGGTILANRAYFEDEPFLVAHADNLTTFDVRRFVDAHAARPSGCDITMLSFETETPQSCGILELDHEARVVAFHEKVDNPPGNLANGAVYIVEPSVIDTIANVGRDFVDLSTEVLPGYMGRIVAVQTDGYHRDIGTPQDLARAQGDAVSGVLRL